ncbi:XRE family transcriptional regulator [Anaerotruncus colihominis]|uniref:XRE family transcriptional regulator n=1 Tax=Anaerotruncus colihominis TaxID=169435 RepID=A0A845RNS8_9FIRM|nr:helix-turn-helix transcriptional regulator [Anaerotruncus colihominis]NBI80441.1 XRE family transcriptional regulator [Anaerotruncus colihominis]
MANYEQFTSKHYLSARLKALRSEKGITQKQLAEQLNTSISSIISYENSIRFPSSAVLGLLSRYFNVSKEYLLGETDERRPAQKWDDPELIQAVRDNISALFDTVEQAVRGVSDEEQKLVFDVMVELRHTLELKDIAQRQEALRLFHDTAPAVLHWPEKNSSGTVDK